MRSPRALGIFALCAVVISAISFGAVDVTLTGADGDSVAPFTVACAVIGTIALLASVLPAITWFIDVVHHSSHIADVEPMRVLVSRASFEDDDL